MKCESSLFYVSLFESGYMRCVFDVFATMPVLSSIVYLFIKIIKA